MAPAHVPCASRFSGSPDVLVRVTFKPSRPGLPLGQGSVSVPDRHFYLRQTLGVEYLVLRDDIVYVEQKSRQCVHLIGRQRPLTIERHGAIEVIPNRRRERRAKRQYSPSCPELNIRASLAFQNGRCAFDARCPVASRAPLRAIDLRALLGSSASGREFLSGRTDGDIPRADFLCARRASHSISRRLRQRADAHEQHKQENPKHSHCERSHRWRSSRAEWCCPAQARCMTDPAARSSAWRLELVTVEPDPVRPCSAKGARSLVRPN